MNRRQIVSWLLAFAAMVAIPTPATAQNVWLSLNLEFNTPGDVTSGGTWTTVAKSDPAGIAGVSMYLANTTFGSFLAPPQFEIRLQSGNTTVRNAFVGDNLVPPYPFGIGVIGSSFPSTYVDPPEIVPFGGNPDYGSFTGGVALATGTFAPGVVPDWTPSGFNVTDANVFTGSTAPPPPSPVVDANTLLTVRYVVPEPATLVTAGLGLIGLVVVSRCRKNR